MAAQKSDTPNKQAVQANAFMSFLVARGLVGLAWADEDLRITLTMGRLAEWIGEEQHVCKDLAPFHGLDDDLHELKDDFRPSLVLPKIGLNVDGDDVEKTSIEVFWIEAQQNYVIVLHQLGAQPEFEADLARQMRARRLAEDHLAKVQREMQDTQSLLDIIVESAPGGLAVFDADKRYQFANRRWLELLGLETEAVTLQRHGDLTSDPSIDLDDVLERTRAGHVVNDDLRKLSFGTEAEQAWRVLRHAPWRDTSGQIGGIISTVDDVSDGEQRLVNAQDRISDLERINSDLESFAALVAHDLRGPLAVARQQVATMLEERAGRSEVDATLERLISILDGLQDYTATSGLPGPAHAVDVCALAGRIVEDALHETDFTYEIAGTWPMLTTAVAPLDLVLRNLVQNALKHHDTAKGHLEITCTEGDNVWYFDVSDDGPGVPVDAHERIFKPLETAGGFDGDNAQRRSSGLGLAFVRRAAESVGGGVDVISDPSEQRGSTFRIAWPK